MITYDQDGNRCDSDLSPAKFITITDHLATLAEKDEKIKSLGKEREVLEEQIVALTAERDRLREALDSIVGVMTGSTFYGGNPKNAMFRIAQAALKQTEPGGEK